MIREEAVLPAADRPDAKERILKLFETVRENLKDKKSVADVSSDELERLADRSGIADIFNMRMTSSGGLGNMLDRFKVAGLDRDGYHSQLQNSLPGVKAAGYERVQGEYADGWMHFHPIGKTAESRERISSPRGVPVDVTYKTYVSLKQDGSMAVKNVDRFLRHLPRVAEVLRDVGARAGVDVSFKIPAHLEEMLMLRDTLVIHTSKKEILPELHDAVSKVLAINTDKPIELERDARGHFGFDFKSTDKMLDGSYSQLLARAMTGRVVAATFQNPHLLDVAQWSDFNEKFLKPALNDMQAWEPQRMLVQLEDPLRKRIIDPV